MNRVDRKVRKVKSFLAALSDKGVSPPYTEGEIDDMVCGDEPELLKLANLGRISRYLTDLLYASPNRV